MRYYYYLSQDAFAKAGNSNFSGKKRVIFERQGFYFLNKYFDCKEKTNTLDFTEVLELYLLGKL